MESKPAQPNILMRVAIIVAIIIILAIISFGIIDLVPKALSSLASANLSFSSLFAPKNSTSTAVVISGATTTENTAPSTTMTWQATSTPTNTSTYTPPSTTYTAPSTVYNNPNGIPDLAIHLVSQGVDPSTGAFVIKFQIQNIGSRSSGAWSFTTNEPMTNPSDQTRYSGSLASLAPGASTNVVTLGLSGVLAQGGVATINVAPVSGETDTANNILSINIPAGLGNGTYSSGTYSTTYGSPDLAVEITNTIGSTVQFTVRNLGSVASSPWTISVTYPGSSNGNLATQEEAGIPAGAVESFTLNLSGIENNYSGYNNYSSTYPVTISIYPQGYDANSSNNTATTVIN